MRTRVLLVIAASLVASAAMAESSSPPKLPKSAQPGKGLPVKGATSANSCAAYGAGFVKVEGTETCVKMGGAISIGVGGAVGGR